MGSKEKLIERFKKLPKDFTFEETLSLLGYFGYTKHNMGYFRFPYPFQERRNWAVHRYTSSSPRQHNESVDDESDLPTLEE